MILGAGYWREDNAAHFASHANAYIIGMINSEITIDTLIPPIPGF